MDFFRAALRGRNDGMPPGRRPYGLETVAAITLLVMVVHNVRAFTFSGVTPPHPSQAWPPGGIPHPMPPGATRAATDFATGTVGHLEH